MRQHESKRMQRVVAATGIVAGLAGCTVLPPKAVEQVRNANQAYLDQRYTEAVRLASPVILEYPDCPDVAEAWYVRGLSHLRMGLRATARADFEQALARSQRPELTALVHAQLGNMDFDDGNYGDAANRYAKAEDTLPTAPATAHILYQYGLALERSGHFGESKFAFAQVFTEYPRGRFAEPARRHYTWPHRHFALQCGVFSKVESAREIANTLEANGHPSRIVKDVSNRSPRYIVQAGRYSAYEDALAAADAVRSIVADAFVLP